MSDTRRVTSTQEKVVVGGALVGGLIFFGFLTGKCQNPLNHLRSTEVATAVTDLNADVVDRSGFEAQITDLEGEIEVLKDNSADERVIADLEAKLFNQKAQAEESIAGYRKRSADLESQIKRLSAAPAI